MKSPTFSIAAATLASCLLLFTACHRDETPQYTIEFTQGDGTRESYTITTGNTLLVHDGDRQIVVKTVSSDNKDELGLDVTSYSIVQDTLKGEHTIQKSGSSSQRISLTKSTLLDPASTVQINLQSIVMAKAATTNPKGACKGICCEAKCFSLWCCADPDECKNVPCDCKPPGACPGAPSGTVTAHVLELFKSGKDLMVFKN